jgi:hypothetical protein
MLRPLVSLASLGALLLASPGCGSAEPDSPFKPVVNTQELMKSTIDPAAQTYWASVATIVSVEGVEEKFPKTNEEWDAIWGAAITVAESGNLLMMPPRRRDTGDWMRLSAALVDIGQQAAKVAATRNPEAVLEVGEKVYNVCTECHMKYITE